MSISLITQRVLFNTTDISTTVSDFRSGIYSLSSTSADYIYMGLSSPMNNLWVEMSTPSASSAGAPDIEVWWGAAWHNVVDIIDQTSGMTASGRISWSTDLLKGWQLEQYSTDVGLSGTAIYNRYWMRINWATSFTASVLYMGQKFSNDTLLRSMYPDLLQPAILEGYKSGKTNWEEQHFMAAEAIIRDLRKRDMIKHSSQVFDWTVFEEASVHKVAEMVYLAFGAPYKDAADTARKRYEAEMASRQMVLDEDRDGHISDLEKEITQGWITR